MDFLSKTRSKWCEHDKHYFINYLIDSSLSLMSTSTMVSNMSMRYLKSFPINFPSKTRLKWCIKWQRFIALTTWWTPSCPWCRCPPMFPTCPWGTWNQKQKNSTSWWTPPSPRRRCPWATSVLVTHYFSRKVILQLVKCYRRMHKKFQRSS